MLFEPFPGMPVEITFFKQVIRFSIAAAVAYCVAVYFFVTRMNYEDSYLLYVGNFLFAAVIGIFIAWFYKQHERDISTIRLVVIGGKAAVAGIVAAVVLVTLMLLLMVPHIFSGNTNSDLVLKAAPGQFSGKNLGFGQILYLNAVLGNMGASFFISLLIPFTVMKNIYPDEKRRPDESPKNEDPKKNYHL